MILIYFRNNLKYYSIRSIILKSCIYFTKYVGPMYVQANLLPLCWEQLNDKNEGMFNFENLFQWLYLTNIITKNKKEECLLQKHVQY